MMIKNQVYITIKLSQNMVFSISMSSSVLANLNLGYQLRTVKEKICLSIECIGLLSY